MHWQALLIGALGLCLCADAQDDAKKEQTKLKGAWTVTSYERDTKQLAAEKAKEIKYSVADDNLILVAGLGFTGGKVNALKLDPAKKPPHITVTPADGRNKDKPFEGIYQLDGDKLKICIAAPGKDRPKEFATKEGAFHILLTLQRDKP